MRPRQAFPQAVEALMEQDDKIVVLLGDIGIYSFHRVFERWPERCWNVGVCEQAMVGLAAGLARAGYKPIVSTIASFLVRRAYEAIWMYGLNELPGILVSVGADGYPGLGPTHKCQEDMDLLRWVPNLTRDYCIDADDVATAINSAARRSNLTYIRLGK